MLWIATDRGLALIDMYLHRFSVIDNYEWRDGMMDESGLCVCVYGYVCVSVGMRMCV